MNTNKRHRNEKKQKRENTNSFYSVKNKREVEFGSTARKYLMMMLEFDSSVTAYEPFEFKVKRGDGSDVQLCPSLRIDRGDDDFELLILSDLLAGSEWAAFSARAFIQAGAGREVPVNFHCPGEVEAGIFPRNISFFYRYAFVPVCPEEFRAVQEIAEFLGKASIKQLKRGVKNWAAIYQLILHGALRVDLENILVDDETVVDASPLINSIIKGL